MSITSWCCAGSAHSLAFDTMRTGLAVPLAALRTLLWTPVFYLGSLIIVLIAALTLPFHRPAFNWLVRRWGAWQRWTARWILGQLVVVDGALPSGGVFIVMKHEAMFEAIDVQMLFASPVVYAKAELFDIPLWGPLARAYGLIPIERGAGASALRAMRKSARAVIDSGHPLILFPEGTRVPPGDAPPLQSGFAGLYKLLGLPVVPIAVASGHLKTRDSKGTRGWIKYPGTICYRVGDTIPPGLPRAVAESAVHSALNALNGAGVER
jgi:1-acyl-sn-glycerol-3-phosphate acyltransferase